jgi:hypothetical protein
LPVEEFVWLHSQSDLTRRIKIPLDEELVAREQVKQLLYDVKKERAEDGEI